MRIKKKARGEKKGRKESILLERECLEENKKERRRSNVNNTFCEQC